MLAALFALGVLLIGVTNVLYYLNIHTKTRDIATAISDYKKKTGIFPDDALVDALSKTENLFPAPSISAPLENRFVGNSDSVDIPDDSYALAYWDGDNFEFYYPWMNSFTTSVPKQMTVTLLAGLTFAVISFGFHRLRIKLNR